MKVKISQDEWWPVYIFSSYKDNEHVGSYEKIAEIPEDKIDWLNKVEEEFEKRQNYLRELFDEKEV